MASLTHKRKRVAIIADPIDNQKGGVHVYTRELVHGLKAFTDEIEFILIRERRDPELAEFRQIVIPNNRIGLGLAALRLFFIVPVVLWWNKVDAVIEPAHFGPFNLPRSIKRITVIHDLTPLLFPQYHRYHSQLLQKIFLRGILRKASLIIANSAYTASDLYRVFPFTRGKVAPIHLGYEPGMMPVAVEHVLGLLSISKPYWLAVGTIEPRKNLTRLLHVYQVFREERSDKVPLVIVGERGWKADAFFQALEKHPYKADIVLTGYVSQDQLNALYSHAIALVYPSEYEGFGLPVLEAFACGCPVICSRVSSLPEVGGEVAWYVDPFDEANISDQMDRMFLLSEQERVRLKQACLSRATLFGWDRHARDFVRNLLALWPEDSRVSTHPTSSESSQ